MPCSCGNSTCLCGIPCYCSEESCKCYACAIALHRFCKICSKPLITDIQTGEDACSCFARETTALILEDQDNPQCRMGNIPMPVGYFAYGKLVVNVVIPVPVQRFPQLTSRQSIGLKHQSAPIQTDSRRILRSFSSEEDAVTPLSPGEDSGVFSTTELNKLTEPSGKPSCHISSGIFSTNAHNTEMNCKETSTPLFSQSTEDGKTAIIGQNATSEIEGHAIVKEQFFYLPSIKIGDISYPVGIEDPVWILPNAALCVAGSPISSLKLCNPFYEAGPIHKIKKMTTLDKECRQPTFNLNFDGVAQSDSASILQMKEQPLKRTKTGQLSLEIHGKCIEFKNSLDFLTKYDIPDYPSLGNSDGITEQWEQSDFNNFPSNEISENYLMHDETHTAAISSSVMQELSEMQLQPEYPVSTSAFETKDCLQACDVGCNVTKAISSDQGWQGTNLWYPRIPSTTQTIPEYVAPNTTSKFKKLFNSNVPNSEENEYSQRGNPRCVPLNDERDKIDSIPLYIDTSTTRKMKELLELVKNLGVGSTT